MKSKILNTLHMLLTLPLLILLGVHHTIAFMQEPAVTTEENIAGVADQSARVNGDDIYIGKYNKVIAVALGGHSLQSGRLVSPSLRRIFAPYIFPYYGEQTDAYWMMSPMYRMLNPIPLETNEALNVMVTVSEVHADHDNWAGVSLAEGPVAPVVADIRTMYDELTATFTQKTWVNTAFTFPVDLPVGRYQVLGCQVRSSNPGIFRLVPVGADHRPGGMIDAGDKVCDTRGQRNGNMGVWCEFDQLTPPTFEMCSEVTNSWAAVKMDLVKVS